MGSQTHGTHAQWINKTCLFLQMRKWGVGARYIKRLGRGGEGISFGRTPKGQ